MTRALYRRTASIAVVLAAAASSMLALPAVASTQPDAGQGPWHRYHQPDFVVPKGAGCSFRVGVHVLFDREFYRVTSRYTGGAPRTELFRGPLMIQYVNVPQRTKVIRNVSGVGIEKLARDGSFLSLKAVSGHFGAVLGPGSDPGRGVYYLGGQGTSVSLNADGTETLKLGPRGTAQNLCPILRK